MHMFVSCVFDLNIHVVYALLLPLLPIYCLIFMFPLAIYHYEQDDWFRVGIVPGYFMP